MTPLRLLLVTDAVGGVWVYSLELARALEPLGVDTILTVAGPPPSAEQRAAAGGIRLIDTGLPLEWLAAGPREMEDAGKALALVAAREGADVVQTSSAALLAGGAFEQPCVAVQHSCVATWWAAVKGTPLPHEFEWRRDLVAQGLARADVLAAPSSAFAGATKRAYRLDRPVLAVHNGRSAREIRALPSGDCVLTAGRLWDEGKNARTLDRVAARVDAPFLAAGSTHGPNGAGIHLERLVQVGSLNEARLTSILTARPVYASAALYEPFGLSVLEAAQSGCALVLSDIPTHRELWDGTAIFVDPRDEAGFAAAIGGLLAVPSTRQRLGQRACERSRRYSPQQMARAMAEIYAQAAQPQLVAGAA